ncbi:MAG: serpin family protein, partial [Actinomycetota bacterium]|nr:serpin family protein [Actinomycetota bacterium]
MQRRTFLSLLALPAIAQVLQSCGDESADPDGTTPVTPRSALKGTAPHVAAAAQEADAAAVAINAFAADLFDRLVTAEPTANVVFSPASIVLALTMTSAGAKGTTLDEMNTVLHVADTAGIHRSMNALSTRLGSVNRSIDNTDQGGTGSSEVQLSIANSLWGQTGLEFEEAFLDLLSAEYDAGLELVDYKKDPESARADINAWVAAQTRDRIPELLAPDVITRAARLTLVNAVYLKANWAEAFDEQLSADEPFAAPDGEVSVRMMHTTTDVGHALGEGWQAVDVPYVFGDLSFTLVMGETAETALPTADEVFAALGRRTVALGLPRFDIETATRLADVLIAMGMPTAFDGDADFSGMTEDEPLRIADVVHQANITVDEEGTEAAAATAVVMETAAEQIVDDPIT